MDLKPIEELPLVAALAKRRAARAEQRAQFAAAREVGLKRRHAAKERRLDPALVRTCLEELADSGAAVIVIGEVIP